MRGPMIENFERDIISPSLRLGEGARTCYDDFWRLQKHGDPGTKGISRSKCREICRHGWYHDAKIMMMKLVPVSWPKFWAA